MIQHIFNTRKFLEQFCIMLMAGSFCISSAMAITPEQKEQLQNLTPEQKQQLQKLSPEQRSALMKKAEEGGVVQSAKSKDKAAPPVSRPRQIGTGRLETETNDLRTDDVEQVSSQQASDKVEIRRSYEEFMREAKPLVVSTSGLKQFGYELFAEEPGSFEAVSDVPVPPEYIIGPGDEIKVQLYGRESKELVLTVDREGAVAFPQIGPVGVARLSFAQAKALLAQKIKQKMVGISASISMGQLRSIRIFALGDVFRPGSYTVSGLATLSSALFASGGVNKIGSLRNIELKRNGKTITTIDLYDFLLRGDTSKDVRLLPGDVVFVPPIGKTVTVAGEVVRPAIYEIRSESTIADILLLAGGLMPKAYLEKALVERVDAKGEQEVINLSLLNNETSMPVNNGDVIKVFAGTGYENNQIMLIGNLKRPGKRAWQNGMRVSSLISSMDDLLPESFLDYGVIEREAEDTREPMLIRFKLGELLAQQARGGELDLPLQSRDRLYVFKRANFREQPMVKIQGSVQTPGDYEYKRNMHLADLVLAAGGLLRDSDLNFAEIYRTDQKTREVQLIKTNLSLAMAADAVNDITLQDMDRVVVHSVFERNNLAQVSILGEVHKPGTLDMGLGMHVSDLVIAGGNVTEMAYLKSAEITRYSVENGLKRVSMHFAVDLAAAMQGDVQANVEIMPYDVLNIRRVSNWREAEKVTINGEVTHPGVYQVEDGETLSSLLKRVGGFTDKAYLPAVVFTRESVRLEQQKQAEELARRMDGELSAKEQSSNSLRDPELKTRQLQALDAGRQLLAKFKASQATGRVVIQIENIAKFERTEYDIKLRNGDTLYIPKRPDEVLVVGEVYNHSGVFYRPDYSRDDYIKQAGLTRMSDASSIYLVRADGRVDTSNGWFSSAIQPGDTIVVPQDLERMNLLDSVLDWSRATMQIGITLASMKTIGVIR